MAGSDTRRLIHSADAAARAGEFAAAVRQYAEAARIYEAEQQPLKAVAVLRQLRSIVARHAQGETALEAEARSKLPALYRSLGLESEARAVENESAPSSASGR